MPKAAKSSEKQKKIKGVSEGVTEEVIEEDTGTLFDEMAEDSYVMVHRIHPITKKVEYLGRISPREATVEGIQEKCGGGMFVCKEKVRNDEGKMVYKRQRSFEVAGPQLPSEKISLTGSLPPTQQTDSKDYSRRGEGMEDGEMSAALRAQVISMLKDHNELVATQMATLRATLEDRKRDTGSDTNAQMMIEMVKGQNTLLAALIANRPEQPDITEQLAKLAEVMKSTTSPQSTVKDTLEMMNNFIGVRQEIDDYQRGPEQPPKDLAELAMEQFGKLVDTIANAKSLEQLKTDVAKLPPPQQPQSQPQPQPQPGGQQPMQQYAAMLKPHIPRFVSLAERGKNPILIADADFETMTDLAHVVLKQLLSSENPLNDVVQAFPELAAHVNWVNQYLGRLHMLYFPEQYQQEEDNNISEVSEGEDEGGLGPPSQPDAGRSGAMVMEPPRPANEEKGD